jgi:hypothetical protein
MISLSNLSASDGFQDNLAVMVHLQTITNNMAWLGYFIYFSTLLMRILLVQSVLTFK